MVTKLIGIGAAGNKAAVAAVNNGIIGKENVALINSTLKDIPHDFDGTVHCFSEAYGGCGKEREISKKYMSTDLQNGSLDIKKILEVGVEGREAELVVLVSSTEGGTGSGSVPLLARYIREVIGTAVRCFSFIGFGDDVRGLRNTVEYFQELKDILAVEAVSNMKYLDEAGGDKIKAEKAANQDFCVKLSVLLGNALRESDHNIDQTDHLKICRTPNFSVVEYREFNKIKNKKEFRDMVQDIIDTSKSIDMGEPSQKRLGVIINIDEANTGVIDYMDILTSHFGECFEKFEHIQHEKSLPQFFSFISAGNNIPIKEIEEVYEEYKNRAGQVEKNPDEFYAKQFEFDAQDNKFNLNSGLETKSASDFFSSLNGGTTTKTRKQLSAVDSTDAY